MAHKIFLFGFFQSLSRGYIFYPWNKLWNKPLFENLSTRRRFLVASDASGHMFFNILWIQKKSFLWEIEHHRVYLIWFFAFFKIIKTSLFLVQLGIFFGIFFGIFLEIFLARPSTLYRTIVFFAVHHLNLSSDDVIIRTLANNFLRTWYPFLGRVLENRMVTSNFKKLPNLCQFITFYIL